MTAPMSSGAAAGLAVGQIPRWRQAAYGLLGMPLAMAALPLYVTIPAWYATRFDVPLAQLGWVLLAVRLIDTVQDPVLGHALDRARPRAVRRAMFVAGIVLALCFAGLWHPPAAWPPAVAWLALMLVLAGAAHSVLNLAHLAWGARLPAPPQDRAHGLLGPAGWREAAGLTGVLVASAVPAALQGAAPETAMDGIALYSLGFALLLAAAGTGLMRWAPPWPGPRVPAPAGGAQAAVRRALAQPGLRSLLLPYTLNALSVALPSTLALFYIGDQLQAAALAPAYLLCYFGAAAAGMPAWVTLAQRYGVVPSWRLGMALAVASFAGSALLGAGDSAWFFLMCVGAGAALGADLALPPVALAERLPTDAPAALCYGALALLGKLALAVAGLALPLLAAAGYQAGHGPHPALPLAYAVLPCLCKLAALLTLGRRGAPSPFCARSPS